MNIDLSTLSVEISNEPSILKYIQRFSEEISPLGLHTDGK